MKQPTQNWVLQKFNKLQKRLLRSITQGTFLKLATDKQLQLTRRVYSYASTVKRSIKPAIVSAFVAVGFVTTANGQIVFTEQTGVANPMDTFTTLLLPKPTFADIDNDGDFDALIGNGATVSYYQNTGSSINATFTRQTGANNPLDTLVGLDNIVPTFVDLDNDGKQDVVMGDFNGDVKYFRNTGTMSSPIFAQQFGANNPFDTIDQTNAGYELAPTFVDLDNDGDKDLILGENYGSLKYFRNTGTASAPVFTQQFGANNPFDTINVGYFSTPAFADLDNDGDFDLLVGETYGTLKYFRNTGTVTIPGFSEQLGTNTPFNGISLGRNPAPAFVDIDGDGDKDIFVGARISLGVYGIDFLLNESPVSTFYIPTLAPKTLVVYPNPTKGILSFEQSLTGLATIYNNLGQSVRALQLNGQNQLSAEGLPVGNYLLRIMTEAGELQLAKFMIKE